MLKGLDPDIRAAALSHWEPLTAERTIFFDLGNGKIATATRHHSFPDAGQLLACHL
jgi:hypothetical protein